MVITGLKRIFILLFSLTFLFLSLVSSYGAREAVLINTNPFTQSSDFSITSQSGDNAIFGMHSGSQTSPLSLTVESGVTGSVIWNLLGSPAHAVGVISEDEYGLNFNNSGYIKVSSSASLDSGVNFYGVLSGSWDTDSSEPSEFYDVTVHNSGTIEVSASSSDTLYLYGIEGKGVSYIGEAGSLLKITGNSSSNDVYIRGFVVENSNFNLSNSGRIEITSTSSGRATVYGVEIYGGDSDTSLNFQNAGEITLRATSLTSSASFELGVTGHLENFLNSGTISGRADGFSLANGVLFESVYGVDSFSNTGAIDLEANASKEGATSSMYLLLVYSQGITSFSNSGNIHIRSTSTGNADSKLIYLVNALEGSPKFGDFSNEGVVDIEAIGGNAEAEGLFLGDASLSTFLNDSSAMFKVVANSSSGYAEASAVEVFSNYVKSFTNRGTIDVEAIGHTSAEAYGLYTDEIYSDADILNDSGGLIKVSVKVSDLDDSSLNSHLLSQGIYVDESFSKSYQVTNSGTMDISASAENISSVSSLSMKS